MIYTLLIRLVGPMQSWGTKSRFDERDTELEPSKSGVIGLVCAALGIDRYEKEPVLELAKLRMGVRVLKEGILQRDYHTAQNVIRADGKGIQDTAVSNRYFLSDAAFLVGLEGQDKELLAKINSALKNPYYPLFLGRKSFLPSKPVFLEKGLLQLNLEDALKSFQESGNLANRLIIESRSKAGALRNDQPLSSFAERKYGTRFVEIYSLEVQNVSL